MSRFRKETPPIDFLRGRHFEQFEEEQKLDREWKQNRKADYYMAQIAFQVYLLRVVVMNLLRKREDLIRPDQKITDFLLEFKTEERKPKEELELTPAELAKRQEEMRDFKTQMSVNRWMALTGMVGPAQKKKA